MKEISQATRQLCLKALRSFLTDYDAGAARWLKANDSAVECFLVQEMDLLSPPERIKLYVFLFGYFRGHYLRVINSRMRTEKDPGCMQILKTVEEHNRDAARRPYSPATTQELIPLSENTLASADPGLRHF